MLPSFENMYFHLVPLVVTLNCNPIIFNGDMHHKIFKNYSQILHGKTHDWRSKFLLTQLQQGQQCINWPCYKCHDPNLGLMAKAKAWKGAGRKCNPRKCEGMNLHIPKWTLILEIGVPMESQIFKKQFERSKLIGLKTSL